MTIRFRRKSVWEWLALFVLVMPFAFSFLMDLLRFPSLVKYTVDIGWMGLLVGLMLCRTRLPNTQAGKLAVIAGVFFGVSLIGFLAQYQSVFYYLWGIRNNARFFVFFFACICFVRQRSIPAYLRFFDMLFWINLPVVLFQYFVMHKAQDQLGGIFGVETGCNGSVNIFLVIIVTKSLLYAIDRRESVGVCLAKCMAALVIAALSELKIFFLEFLCIGVLSLAVTKFSFRKLWIGACAAAGVLAAIRLFVAVFPEYSDWFRIERIWNTLTDTSGYTAQNDMNRLTAVPIAWKTFLPTTFQKLFGLGLGSCDYASFDFLVTPFYRAYEGLHYTWFSVAFLILETGVVGLGAHVLFFAVLFFQAGKREKARQAEPVYCRIAKITAVMCLALIFYNASMRSEAAYMLYFILALPFVPREQPVCRKGAG